MKIAYKLYNETLAVEGFKEVEHVIMFLISKGQQEAADEIVYTQKEAFDFPQDAPELGKYIFSLVLNAELWMEGSGNAASFEFAYQTWKSMQKR